MNILSGSNSFYIRSYLNRSSGYSAIAFPEFVKTVCNDSLNKNQIYTLDIILSPAPVFP